MRVRQLAIDLGVSVTKLEKFLSSKLGMEEIHNPNLKLEQEVIDQAISAFGLKITPEESKIETTVIETKTADKNDIIDISVSKLIEQKLEISDDIIEKDIHFDEIESAINSSKSEKDDIKIVKTDETTLHIKNGVITAPKFDLKGFTVKGKIDLPEPKVKEKNTTELDTEEHKAKKEVVDHKVIPSYTPKPKQKKIDFVKKKSIPIEPTLHEIKEKEKHELEKRLAQKKEYQEKIRKEHYFNEVQPKIKKTIKKKKKIENITEHISSINIPKDISKPKSQPKSTWAKFTDWLNS